ncbi:MAG: lipase [Candidatus Neomarinimicrobiota bacterium]|nr:MAG: lipase [Candidatus Neomarinimicrobiota bacterium]
MWNHLIRRLLVCLFLGAALWGRDATIPIVLVHGFIGWGPEELGSYRYWGGSEDLAQTLRDSGFTVFVVSVGPVSSNWDRAVEVYTQLKGGQVDYGKRHAETFGIIQKPEGKTYPGLYPEWDEHHPVHFIGHSMGGQTIRMLDYLLTHVIYADEENQIPEASSLLGQEHHGWIRSITTLATPHDGTTLSDLVTRSIPFLQYVLGLAAMVGSDYYNFDLEQWGFERKPDESWMEYFERMKNHPAWKTKNISAWDLSVEGARQLNTRVQADPEVYYFSFVFRNTHRDSATGAEIPDSDMNIILRMRARIIGSEVAFFADGTATDSTWFPNDGVVNTRSQYGPTTGLNGPDPIAEYHEGEPLIKGQWYTIGPLRMDHWRSVGHGKFTPRQRQELVQLYLQHCKRLMKLP